MKFRVFFKCPDNTMYEDIREMTPNEEEQEELFDLTRKFVEFGEQVCIEFDSETGTAVLVPVEDL